MTLTAYTDGGSLNNPGPAASAYAIYSDNRLVYHTSVSIGKATNNVAEYTALILCLEKIRELFPDTENNNGEIFIYSDSSLMVNQLNGIFKVKNGTIREFVFKIRGLEQDLRRPIRYTHVPREKNRFVDSLVKKSLFS